MSRAVIFCLIAFAHAQATRGVSVHVTLERFENTRWTAVDPHLVLHGGDQVRFRFRSNKSGFLYVINHDAQGRNTWLFPTPETGRQNSIEPDKDYLVPNSGIFEIAKRTGYETTYWILAPEELRGPKAVDPAIIQSDRTPLLPRCGSGSLVPRGPCTDEFAGAHPVRSAGSLQARGLSVDDSGGQSQISLPGAFEAPFIYEFRIAHQ